MSEQPIGPGRIPPQITGTAAYVPLLEQWNPESDQHLPDDFAALVYVPPTVLAPPQLPRPEQHPHRPDFPPRGIKVMIGDATKDLSPGSQLAFTASTVQVDNYSNQWLFFPSAQRWVPPAMFHLIMLITPGTQVAEYRVAIPVGHAAGTVGLATSPVVTTWFEELLVPSVGVFLAV
jgi:hypothetical protein